MILGRFIIGTSAILLFGLIQTAGAAGLRPERQAGVQEAEKSLPATKVVNWPHDQSDLAPDPRAMFGRLGNGFRYVVVPNRKPRERISLHLVVLAGSLNETDAQRGIAHFLEHMLFNGTTHFPPGELVKYFQKIGMQFGPDANAHTGFYNTVYDINLPASDPQSLHEALQVMQDYAEGALLLPSEIDRERGVILAEKRTRDSADYRAYVASMKFELAGTLFPDRLPMGSEAVIRSADRAVFKNFYDTWYRPDNMVLVLVGDLDGDMARKLIEKQFGSMAARAPAGDRPHIGAVAQDGLKTFYHHEAELGGTSVTVQMLNTTPPPPDDAVHHRRQIEEQMANQIIQNRLNRRINQAGSPITDASVSSGVFLRQVRYGYISADCQPEDWRKALTLVEQELRQALQHGFDPDEVKRVQKDYRAGLEKDAAQATTRESADIAQELIYDLTNDNVFRSPTQERDFADPIVAAVTADDLRERLRAVWGKPQRQVLVSGNVRIAVPNGTPEDEIASVFKQAQNVAVAPPTAIPSVAFPYLDRPSQEGRIADRREFSDIGVTMLRFANNVRLNVKATKFTADEVQFVLSFGQGRAGVPLKASALAALAEDVVNESGLGRLDKEALAQALAGKKTDMQFSLQDDRFAFNGQSTPGEIELAFQLLNAAIRDPAFREDAWQLALRRYQQTYQSMQQSVDGVMNLYGWRFLSGGDPRFGLPPADNLAGLAVGDLAQWIGGELRHGAMELSIVGDVDPEEVIHLAARYLGSLPARRDASDAAALWPGPSFPEARQMEMPVPTQIDKALLVMALPTDDIWNIERTRRLNVLADIISERLRQRVREKLGAAYSADAFSWPSRTYQDYGVLVIYIPLAPDAVELVRATVIDILKNIRERGVSPEELQRALEPTLKGIRDRFRENDYWLGTVLVNASRHPEQLDWSRTIMADYASIRTADIAQVAGRYLDLAKLAVIEAHAVSAP
jgi:zinc protease